MFKNYMLYYSVKTPKITIVTSKSPQIGPKKKKSNDRKSIFFENKKVFNTRKIYFFDESKIIL